MIVVERGESLGRIAERYHVPKRAIIEANHLQPPYDVAIGQRLVLPGGEAPPPQIAQGNAIPLDGAPAPQQQAARAAGHRAARRSGGAPGRHADPAARAPRAASAAGRALGRR